jgi:AraC family transcriptional regulator
MFSLGQTIGRVPRRWGTPAIILSPIVHERARLNDAHAHEAAFVSMVIEGDYAETAGQRSLQYERFTAFYHPPQLEHVDRVGSRGARLLFFEFRLDLLDGLGVNAAAARSLRDLSATPAAWELLSLYASARNEHDPLDFEARALAIIAGIFPRSAAAPRDVPSLHRVREYLHTHYHERIAMHDLASAAGLHPVYLGQMFRREAGETIGNYVNRLRVRAAAEALAATGDALAAIAYDHGFCDQSHFQRVFRKVSGLTPAAFRAKFG